jgi:thiosulfate/3-mercaptopyruvate sulfurtransferase
MLARLGDPGTVMLDARSADEYAGLRVKPAPGFDHGAERAGHIPGAIHLPATRLLTPGGTFRGAAEIEEAFRGAGAAPDQAKEVFAYCRLGHRASLMWFAMSQILGWEHARVYDGSWTEWGSCVGMPVQR